MKEYVYREQMNTWIHLSMLFMLPDHWPRNVIGEIHDRSIMNFLYDYSHGMETRSPLANVPEDASTSALTPQRNLSILLLRCPSEKK